MASKCQIFVTDPWHFLGIGIVYSYYVCYLKIIGISENKEICLQQEYISNYRCERINMAVKCKPFMTVTLHYNSVYKNKYNCVKRKTYVITDMKEQIWVSKFLWMSLNTLYALGLCIDTYICAIQMFLI